MKKKQGKVWLVGAGPGDPGLFTLKGKQVLAQAQVVVYDALVGSGILAMIPAHAKQIYVGKRAGNHAMAQEDISRLLAEKAQEGLRVVRLKGGDPFLFGRGGEELLTLRAYGVDYEVVPGISSALAVPAYNGIPVTHRGMAGSVHIITGHKRAGEVLDLPYQAYVQTGGTLVFLMGLAALPDIVRGLLDAGMDTHTPAAVLEKGTTAGQRRVCTTLDQIVEAVAQAQIQTPAVTVVGAVTALSGELAWYEHLPLFGHRFVLTRPVGRMAALAGGLRVRGAEVIELPAIETKARVIASEYPELFENIAKKCYDCLVFTSPAGVQCFFDQFYDAGYDARSLAGLRLAVIGSGTAGALRAYGLAADLMPEAYNGESLGDLLRNRLPDGSRVLILRSSIGNPKLVTHMGASLAITDLAVYDTVAARADAAVEQAFLELAAQEKAADIHECDGSNGSNESNGIDGIIFTSASTVREFLHSHPQFVPEGKTALCIGEMTAQEARKAGMKVQVAEESSVEGLLALVERVYVRNG